MYKVLKSWASQVVQLIQNLPANTIKTEKMRVQTLGLEDPLERKWQSTPAFFPGKTHGQRSLADCSPWGWTQLST